MTSQEIKKWLKRSSKQLIGRPYKGNALEEKIVDNVINAIQKKIKKFDTYQQCKSNILLIHTENRFTLGHDFVIKKTQKYASSINIKFDYLVLKLGLKFYFFV